MPAIGGGLDLQDVPEGGPEEADHEASFERGTGKPFVCAMAPEVMAAPFRSAAVSLVSSSCAIVDGTYRGTATYPYVR